MNVISLFDKTGNMVEPWNDAGHQCHTFDLQHNMGFVHARDPRGVYCHDWDLSEHESIIDIIGLFESKPGILFAFPPCTDLAVSGARWFKAKAAKNPRFQEDAIQLVMNAVTIAESLDIPYMIENPVSVLSTKWRKPDYIFHPWQYSGYCLNDNYTKRTCLWTGGGFVMPETAVNPWIQKAINHVIDTLGKIVPIGIALKQCKDTDLIKEWYPDDRVHKCAPSPERANLRSATPKGFAEAVFLANNVTNITDNS